MADLDGKIHTACGPISPDDAECTLMHQHILFVHSAAYRLESEPDALEEVSYFYQCGGRTIVELSSVGLRRPNFMPALRRISHQSRVHIVLPAGYYKRAWVDSKMASYSADEICEQALKELRYGIDGRSENPTAGILGELGVSNSGSDSILDPFERNNLLGAARAHMETGAPINVHFEIGTPLRTIQTALSVFDEVGVNPDRIVVSHRQAHDTEQQIADDLALASRGFNVEYDLFAYEWPSMHFEREARHIQRVAAVHSSKVLISPDILDPSRYHKNTLTPAWDGYAYTLNIAKEMVQHQGFPDTLVERILIENPRRILPWTLNGWTA